MVGIFNSTIERLSRNSKVLSLDDAIKVWCKEADIPYEEIKPDLDAFLQDNSVIQDVSKMYKKLLEVTNHKLPRPINIVGEFFLDDLSRKLKSIIQTTQKEIHEMEDIKLFLLVAFVLTGIGFMLSKSKSISLSRTAQKRENTFGTRSYSSTPQPISDHQVAKKNILFLVLKTYKVKNVIGKLKQSGITNDIIDEVFSIPAIESLWQGTEDEFRQTRLEQYFAQPEALNQSEYDVYLVKIELDNKSYEEFKEGSSSMSRYKAFRQLIGTSSQKITVSKRISGTDYDTSVLYR
jgi:hypothetical protein